MFEDLRTNNNKIYIKIENEWEIYSGKNKQKPQFTHNKKSLSLSLARPLSLRSPPHSSYNLKHTKSHTFFCLNAFKLIRVFLFKSLFYI